MGHKQAQPREMSGLEQYIRQTQQSFERTIANAETPEARKGEQLACKISLWEVDSARKYTLTPSALAMIARLTPERSQRRIETIPGTGIWAVLNNQERTNLYFSSIPHATTSYLESHPNVKLIGRMASVAARPWQWTLDIMQLEKHPLSYLYDTDRARWTLNTGKLCPSGLCERTGYDRTTGWPGWYICEECRPAFEYWTSWFPVALMAINGDFAETEERQKAAQVIEREVRRVRRPGGVGYDETKIIHTYHMVTFDISVKPHIKEPQSEEHEPLYSTWLEQAIENETVVYVSKHIGQTQRTFSHERYVNMRGKTIDVRPYDKRIAMSIKHLKQTIYRAIASR